MTPPPETHKQSFLKAVRIAREVGKFNLDEVVKANAAVTREVRKARDDPMSMKAGVLLEKWDGSATDGVQFTMNTNSRQCEHHVSLILIQVYSKPLNPNFLT